MEDKRMPSTMLRSKIQVVPHLEYAELTRCYRRCWKEQNVHVG